MRLILHAGTHKTGTSTLQRAFHGARELLVAQGVLYPDASEHFGGHHSAHHPFVHRIAERGADDPQVRSFVDRVVRASRGLDVVLLSAEPLYRHVLAHDEGPWWDRHRRYLEEVAAVLAPFDVSPLLVFRRRDTFLESLYHEHVGQGFSGTFEQYVGRSDRFVDYDRQAGLFRAAFGGLQTASYERLASHDLVTAFCELLGIPLPTGTGADWERRSPDARLTLWMARGNAADDRTELVTQRRRFSKHPATRDLLGAQLDQTLWPDDEPRRELLRSYGDLDPIEDDRPRARLDDVTATRLDAAFHRYLVDKGLDALAASVPATT